MVDDRRRVAVHVFSGRLHGDRAKIWSRLENHSHPVEPFEIVGGLYYVGTSDIAIFDND